MAGGTRDLIVRFLADTKDLVEGMGKAEGGFGKLKSAAVVAGGAIAAGFAASKVVDFLGDSVKAAEEDQRAQTILAQTLKNTTNATDDQIASVEKWVDKTQRATGIADDDLRPALQNLVVATGNVSEAQNDMKVAMDIATAKGLDLETVTKAMAKAHEGNSAALQKLGIDTKDAAGNTLSFDQIMQNANATFGGATAAAADTASGRMARMNIAVSEIKESVGNALIPVLAKLAEFAANTLLPAIQSFIEWVEANWPQISATIKADVDKVMGYVMPVIAELQDLWDRFGTHIIQAAKGAWDEVVGQIKVAIALVQAVVQPIIDILHGDWGKAWDDFSRRIGQAWEGIKQSINGAIEIIKGYLGGLVEAVAGLPGKIAGAAANMWAGIVDATKKLPGQIASAAVGLFDGVINAGKAAFNKVIDLFNELLSHIGLHIHIDPPGPGSVNFDWDAPQVPHLDTGGTILGTGLAVVHKGETVMPAGGGGGVNIYGDIHLYGVQTDSQLFEQLDRMGRNNNGIAITGGVRAV